MATDVLPRWERFLYWIGGGGCMIYCYISFYKECQANVSYIQTRPGSKWLGGKKDFHDLEWGNFLNQLPYLTPLLAGHVCFGQFLFHLKLEIWQQKVARLLYDLLAIAFLFGIRATALCIVESLIMYFLTFQRFVIFPWLVAMLFTTSLNIEWILKKQVLSMGYSLMDNVTFFVSVSYLHIRLISGGVEMVKCRNAIKGLIENKESDTANKKYSEKSCGSRNQSQISNKADNLVENKKICNRNILSIVDFMSYVFYLPIFFQGPILTFDKFCPQLTVWYESEKHHYNLKDIGKRLTRIIFWAGFIEVQSHFMYITSVQHNWKLVQTMSVPSVIALGLWQGQFFQMKYICLFGVGSLISTLDGQTTPPQPVCISWIYSFSDMWKYFDVGLYNFVKKYIYIPWGGSKAGLLHQIFCVVLAFLFICNWHGADTAVFIWCFGNLMIIVLEIAAAHFESSAVGSKLKSILGPQVELRLRGFIRVPVYLASGLQVTFFFFSVETGLAMADKMVWKASWETLLLEYVGFYFAIQNAMLVHKWILGRQKNN